MKRINTAREALELLEKAVATRGEDFVYQKRLGGCLYVYQGKPDCLIGVALIDFAGWPLSDLERFCPVASVAREFPGRIGADAVAVLQAAQDAQDAGETWGQALRAARNKAEALRAS